MSVGIPVGTPVGIPVGMPVGIPGMVLTPAIASFARCFIRSSIPMGHLFVLARAGGGAPFRSSVAVELWERMSTAVLIFGRDPYSGAGAGPDGRAGGRPG